MSNTKSSEERDTRPFHQAILARINDFVSRRGMSRTELGRRIDLSKQSVSRLLRGEQTLTVDQVLSIAEALEVPPEELFGVGPPLDPAEARLIAAARRGDAQQVSAALAELGIRLRAPTVRGNPSAPDGDRVGLAAQRIRESADTIQSAADVLREAADALVDE